MFRSSNFWFLVFGQFWRRSYENTKILSNLCLHFARQDGQDRKKITQLKWSKYQKPKDKKWDERNMKNKKMCINYFVFLQFFGNGKMTREIGIHTVTMTVGLSKPPMLLVRLGIFSTKLFLATERKKNSQNFCKILVFSERSEQVFGNRMLF